MRQESDAYKLVDPIADAHQETADLASERTITLAKECNAVYISARGAAGVVSVTFDNTSPSTTNGLGIVVGAQPVFFPIGYHAHENHNIKALGIAAQFLDVLQLN